MYKPKVKICGIQTLEAAEASIEAGADYLGFNCIPASERYINIEEAAEIVKKVAGRVKTVGIFQDETPELVNFIANTAQFDMVQLHGAEDVSYVDQIKKPVIKALSFPLHFDLKEALFLFEEFDGHVEHFLIDKEKDAPVEGTLDMNSVAELAEAYSLFLAGGLTPDNVKTAVMMSHPYGVDVARGIETKKEFDAKKVREFIANATS